jgi:hypothetical protein
MNRPSPIPAIALAFGLMLALVISILLSLSAPQRAERETGAAGWSPAPASPAPSQSTVQSPRPAFAHFHPAPSNPSIALLSSTVPAGLEALRSLAESSPMEAIDALDALLSNETGQLDGAVSWVIENPVVTAAWIESLPDGPLRNGVVERLLGFATSRNPTAAMCVAESISGDELRDSALTSVARRWAADAPAEALASFANREDGEVSPMLGRTFQAAITAHPRQIAELLALLPEGTVDTSFLTAAAEVLLAGNPDALIHWWQTFQDDATARSAIASAVALHAGRHGPELAFEWAAHIEDPAHRMDTLMRFYGMAVQRDEQSATTLLSSPWLSGADREVISGQ